MRVIRDSGIESENVSCDVEVLHEGCSNIQHVWNAISVGVCGADDDGAAARAVFRKPGWELGDAEGAARVVR